jgi:ribose 5-phosphate isomerase B
MAESGPAVLRRQATDRRTRPSRAAPATGPATPVTAASAAPSEDQVRDVVRRVVDAVLQARTVGPVAGPPSTAGRDAPAPSAPAERTIAIGADHGGLRLKDLIAHTLAGEGWQVRDCGTATPDPVDYPDFAHAVARMVADGSCSAGIVVDGAGIGSCMAANKVPGVRAALCYDISSARNSREHNHANVLTLGGRLIGDGLALEVVKTWLETPWGGGRHGARVEKITDIERRYLRVPAGEEAR